MFHSVSFDLFLSLLLRAGGAAREDSDSYDTRRFDASALSSDDGDEYDDEPDSGNTADSPGATAGEKSTHATAPRTTHKKLIT